jgi:phosphoglycolate phosphatase
MFSSMELARYRHIIWDWNGTLLDDLDYCIEIINGMLRRRGLPPVDRSRYHQVFDFPVRDYYVRVGFDLTVETFEEISIEFISAYDARRLECKLHSRAADTLAAIQRAGISQSILSAYRHETLVEIVAHFGLAGRFVRLNGLGDIYARSKVDLGRAWVEELGLPRRQILLVGDTLHDLEVARELGLDCILVAAGHHPAARLRARHDRVIETLAELGAE